jgi:thiamine biosynthesis lipoprotein
MTTILAHRPRTLHVEHLMGTVFTIDIRDPGDWGEAVSQVIAFLHQVDDVFSTYRTDSDISRIRRSELTVRDADPRVAEVLTLCAEIEDETSGYFNAGWRGGIDPTGIVKGWAIERASVMLRCHGSANHTVNGGGDIQIAGERSPGQPWRVGISDPVHRMRLLTTVSGREFAVASSGTSERGQHIIDPHTGRPACELRGVTVIGPELTRVDAYATAAFAMGPDAIQWAETIPNHEALTVGINGHVRWTTGFVYAAAHN